MIGLDKFTSISAKEYGQMANEKRLAIVTKNAENIVSYVNKHYESLIKKEINKNALATSVSITIPRRYKIKNEDEKEVVRVLKEAFQDLGFNVYFTLGDNSCICPFTFICNEGDKVELTW